MPIGKRVNMQKAAGIFDPEVLPGKTLCWDGYVDRQSQCSITICSLCVQKCVSRVDATASACRSQRR